VESGGRALCSWKWYSLPSPRNSKLMPRKPEASVPAAASPSSMDAGAVDTLVPDMWAQ
jgi:hypothetical protein